MLKFYLTIQELQAAKSLAILRDPSVQNNQAIINACEKGKCEIVGLLLSAAVSSVTHDARVNPADQNNLAIKKAPEHGYMNIVRLLLDDKRANPVDGKNNALIAACSDCYDVNARLPIIELLLNDPRIDPTMDNYRLLKIACARHNTKLLELLLSHPKVDKNYNPKEELRKDKSYYHSTMSY